MAVVGDGCSGTLTSDFKFNEDHSFDKCYQIVSTEATANAAYANCNSLGGWLGIPTNAAENEYFYNKFSSQTWIGYNDKANERTWVREGDQSSTYAPWYGGNVPPRSLRDCAYITSSFVWYHDWVTDKL